MSYTSLSVGQPSVYFTPETWLFSFHKFINIRRHNLSGSQFQDVIQVLVHESWMQLCFIYIHYRENLLTKIHGSKCVQNISSQCCQVGVVWQKILIKCVQASRGKFALQIQVTLQVYYFKLNVGRHIRGIHGEWRAKHFEVFLQFIKNLKALLKLRQQSRYFNFEPPHMCSMLSRAHIFQTRQVSSATTRELHLPQWQLQLERTYAVIILRDNFVSPFKHFVQVIYVLCNVNQESEVLHPLCGPKFQHWFAFSFKLFDFFS